MTKKMTFAQKAADRVARASRIGRWPPALEAMKEKTGATVKDFCDAHGVNETQLSHILSGRRGAAWETIRQVDDALRGILGERAFPPLDNPVD